MIPKVIHYCWFGGKELPDSAVKCIESWRKYLPGCEIKEWNESNFDYKKRRYTQEAYEKKKYAFVSDVARLEIIYNEGGIYLDVDVELIKDISHFLNRYAYMGFQEKNHAGYFVNTGLGFGSEANNSVIKDILRDYDNINFIREDGSFDTLSCPVRNSKILEKYGLVLNGKEQRIRDIDILEPVVLCPINEMTGKINIDPKKTYSIHHFNASWISKGKRIKRSIRRFVGPNIIKIYMKIRKLFSN